VVDCALDLVKEPVAPGGRAAAWTVVVKGTFPDLVGNVSEVVQPVAIHMTELSRPIKNTFIIARIMFLTLNATIQLLLAFEYTFKVLIYFVC
jgi:hypothetical protein